jgi:hypothetical protein
MRWRILCGACLACLLHLAATLPRSISDTDPRLTNISPPTGRAAAWQKRALKRIYDAVKLESFFELLFSIVPINVPSA